MAHFLLFCFYHVTRNWIWFHRGGRLFALHVEVRLIKFIYFLFGQKRMYSRNSIHDSSSFNMFMSDLDFSFVINHENDVKFIKQIGGKLKYIFPNLGEFEFYNSEEWIDKQRDWSQKAQNIWNNIRLIRKINWQKTNLLKSESLYSKTKQTRGKKITLNKLGQSSMKISGEKVFRDVNFEISDPLPEAMFPQFSIYLETSILIKDISPIEGVSFENHRNALLFYHLLPTSNYVFQDDDSRDLKKNLVLEELLTTKSYRRLQMYNNISQGELDLINKWIFSLEKLMIDLING